MDIIKRLGTINGNYFTIIGALTSFLLTILINIYKRRKNWEFVLSVISNCDNRIILNQFQDALDEYEEILKNYKLNKYNRGFVLYQTGFIYHQVSLTKDKEKNIKQGLYYYHNAITIFPEYGSFRWRILSKEKRKLIGYAMNGLAHIQNDMAMIRETERFTKASLESSIIAEKINKECNEKYQLAITYSNLAVSYRTRFDVSKDHNDFDKALEYNRLSISLLKNTNNKNDIARVENNLGNLFIQKGQLENNQDFVDKGIKHLENSKELYNSHNFPYEHARSCMNIGAAYFYKSKVFCRIEDINIGIDNLEISINIFEKLGSKMEQATASLNVINLYKLKFEQTEKVKYLKKSYRYSCEIVEVLSIISNPVLSQKVILQKTSISFSLYSITNDEKYFESGVDAYRLLNSEKENSMEVEEYIQLMRLVAKMNQIHFSFTNNFDSLKASKSIYKQIYDNKKASEKDKFISWSKYTEILVWEGEYDQAISAVELSTDLAKTYLGQNSRDDEVDVENACVNFSEEIEQLYIIRDLIFVISDKKGNYQWRDKIDKILHEIFADLLGLESIILGV